MRKNVLILISVILLSSCTYHGVKISVGIEPKLPPTLTDISDEAIGKIVRDTKVKVTFTQTH